MVKRLLICPAPFCFIARSNTLLFMTIISKIPGCRKPDLAIQLEICIGISYLIYYCIKLGSA
jgi:hypothetical protein